MSEVLHMTTYCLTFSPCDSTLSIANVIAHRLDENAIHIDLTRRDVILPPFESQDVLIVACPVYGGRIPTPAAQRLRGIVGNGARAIAIVVFGNRAFDDALLETVDILAESQVVTIAAGAFVARHSLVPAVAQNRPDEDDVAQIDAFAREAARRVAAGVDTPVAVPGNRPYKEYAGMPVSPVANPALCIRCGLCAAVCPVGAIDSTDPTQTDAKTCILCMRCVEACQARGRALPAPVREAVEARLSALLNVRAQNEVF